MAELDRLEHLVLGQLERSGLDHHHGVGVPAIARSSLLYVSSDERRVDDELVADVADAHRADRPVERDVRDAESAAEAPMMP